MNSWDDDENPRSPQLQAIKLRASPTPDPSFIPPPVCKSSPESDRESVYAPDGKARRRKKKKKKKRTAPSQGLTVLVGFLSNGNRPDIAREAGDKPLGEHPDSGTNCDTDDEMDSEPSRNEPLVKQIPHLAANTSGDSEASCKDPGDSYTTDDQARNRPTTSSSIFASTPDIFSNDSRRLEFYTYNKEKEENGKKSAPAKVESNQPYPFLSQKPISSPSDTLTSSSNRHHLVSEDRKKQNSCSGPRSRTPATEQQIQTELMSTIAPQANTLYTPNGVADAESLATSPIAQFTISDSQGSPNTLPPMHSPNGQQSLPGIDSIGPFSKEPPPLAVQTRPSFPPINASMHSPPQEFHKSTHFPQFPSIQTRTNGYHPTYPTTEPSPASTVSEASPRETYRPGHDRSAMSPPGKYVVRPHQPNGFTPQSVSDIQTPLSAESQPSTGSFSAETSPKGDQMSIDADQATLPPLSASAPIGSGAFKCDYVGCTAPPFQTQYLLK